MVCSPNSTQMGLIAASSFKRLITSGPRQSGRVAMDRIRIFGFWDCFSENLSQVRSRGVSIRIRLKIGNIGVAGIFAGCLLLSGFNLLCDGKRFGGGEVAGTALTAEDAATGTKRTIAVGAGHAAIQRRSYTVSLHRFFLDGS